MPVLVALFVLYVGLVTWQMRRAVSTRAPAARRREAARLLAVVSLGGPLLAALILVVW
jgi:cytochrome oxidase assembly protein ShyY1